jgi:hypothetical protein
LFHAVEGASPFGKGNAHALLWRTAQGERVEPKRAGALRPLLDRLLEAEPKRRITIGDARIELGRITGTPVTRARTRGRRRRWIWAGAAAAALVVLAAAVWPVLRPDDAGEPGSAPDGLAEDYIGDPATADPCALLDLDALGAYGEARLDTDDGNFNHCDVVLDTDTGWVDLELYFYHSTAEPDRGETTMHGPIGVIRYEGEHGECERTLVLPDGGNLVSVDAEQDDSGGSDLCAIADTATEGALAVLDAGPVPRRGDEAPASLIHADACGLLDDEALERFPGVDAHDPFRGFGDWQCIWYSTTSDRKLELVFDRDDPPKPEDGERIELAGRTAFIEGDHWGEDTCLVSLIHRDYPSGNGDGTTTADYVRVIVSGGESQDERCALAVDLAGSAATALPDL